jgi:hypothetical protein
LLFPVWPHVHPSAASISLVREQEPERPLATLHLILVSDKGGQAMRTQAATQISRKDRRPIEVISFEERVALLLLTTADGNRALIDEAIRAVADEGLSALPDVLDYMPKRRRPETQEETTATRGLNY